MCARASVAHPPERRSRIWPCEEQRKWACVALALFEVRVMRLPITTPCLLLLLGAAPAVAGPAGGAIDAIWRSQELRLVYFSSTMHYSCGALQEKIAAVLMAVGAAAPVVQIPSCSLDGRLMSSAIVRIWLRSPAPATSENIHAAATFNATEKLIARVRNERLPT